MPDLRHDTISAFFLPPSLVRQARANIAGDPWAAESPARWLPAADPGGRCRMTRFWAIMYGPTITRSWDVWSTGHCPSCGGDVPCYNWIIDALARPWKVMCPHCRDLFPKNDYPAFYRSGLDAHHIYDDRLADRSLLFNVEHPDPHDPLHQYGVDDGEGYVDGEKRWRFIGAYLIYGQWKQLTLCGINNLTAAFVLTGDPVYAHKAAILLDRVADLYPSFDHMTQAWVEEVVRTEGYVSTWHDACEETREMALAYDCLRPAILADEGLAQFLSGKALRYGIAQAKDTPADLCANIEAGILRDPIKNPQKIYSNYPRREITLAVIHGVLGEREAVEKILDEMLDIATAIDGVTGEKGLAAYSAYVVNSLACFLAQLERIEPGTLQRLLQRHPKLRDTYRFHIDTWCLQHYYPQSGDTGWYAVRDTGYRGFDLQPLAPNGISVYNTVAALSPSLFTFCWVLYEATGDPAYIQVLYHANGGSTDGLPYDLYARDAEDFRARVAGVIEQSGAEIRLGNVLKKDWHLAILRAGQGEDARAIWLDYDTGGRHAHADGLNLGLFAKGLDLMPEFGYPPLQFSGWDGPHANWYRATAAHNTVVIDGKNQPYPWSLYPIAGRCTLWGDGHSVSAVRASCLEFLVAGTITEVVDLTGSTHEMVGLYFFHPGTVECFRVYTKPEDGSADWVLQLEDHFDRDALGEDWQALDGEWTIASGKVTGHGILLCTRHFPGCQRIEYLASSSAEPLCDLSAYLAGDNHGVMHCAFFGFGSHFNAGSKISLLNKIAVSSDARITPDQRYHITCERDGAWLRHCVDGREIQHFHNAEESVRRAVTEAGRGKQYERTIVQVNISAQDSYYLDIFRVVGGRDHAKFMHSHFGTLTTAGLLLRQSSEYGHDTLMRSFYTDPAPAPGWIADWEVEDRYGYLSAPRDIHLRYLDVTTGAGASTCEGWVVEGSYNSTQDTWIPRLLIRRTAEEEPLASTFAGIIHPYDTAPEVVEARRLPLTTPDGTPYGDAFVAVEVLLADGCRDLLIAADSENPLACSPSLATDRSLVQPGWHLTTDAELCVVRRDGHGHITTIALGRGTMVEIDDLQLQLQCRVDYLELRIADNHVQVLAGDEQVDVTVTRAGQPLEASIQP